MNTIQMYDAQADSIKVEDIATNESNRDILRRIKRNCPSGGNILYIQNQHGGSRSGYIPEGVEDMGWLGYFVGKNNHIKELYLRGYRGSNMKMLSDHSLVD